MNSLNDDCIFAFTKEIKRLLLQKNPGAVIWNYAYPALISVIIGENYSIFIQSFHEFSGLIQGC